MFWIYESEIQRKRDKEGRARELQKQYDRGELLPGWLGFTPGQWRAKTFFGPTAALELLDLVLDMLWCMRMIKKDSACFETALSPEQRRRLFQHTPQTIHISPPDEFWQVPVYYPLERLLGWRNTPATFDVTEEHAEYLTRQSCGCTMQ